MQDEESARHEVLSVRPKMTAALMDRTGLDDGILTTLVVRFYARVRADAVLGPIFKARIGDWAHSLKAVELPDGRERRDG